MERGAMSFIRIIVLSMLFVFPYIGYAEDWICPENTALKVLIDRPSNSLTYCFKKYVLHSGGYLSGKALVKYDDNIFWTNPLIAPPYIILFLEDN
jgi:hypothetical protein